MAVDSKTLDAIAKWGRAFCKGDRARAATQRSSTKPEGTMSVSKALAESRRRAGGSTATDVSKQTGTARFVSWVNDVAKARDDADRAAAERAAQRVQKDGAAGANARPEGSSAGSGSAHTRASTADGPQSLWGFFNKNWRR
ncbi:hypothetical protein [Burkholderia ubonensis]|uniref:hypothetical protein n=1 Tax=Burkholderia ubonensis TaxID=101571 RepID=UPI000A87C562|nr:hypothetical protein [Burkholderia ubonensis]